MSQIIFQNETYKAEFFDIKEGIAEDLIIKNSNKLILTFNFYGQISASGKGWGGEAWHQQGYTLLAITTNKNDWYNNLDDQSLKIISDFISSKTYQIKYVLAFGTSMGGFAAIAFADSLLVDRVIAFSPQYAIDKDWDTRWKADSLKLVEFNRFRFKENSKVQYYIFYDKFDLDFLHVKEYKKVIKKCNLHLFQIPRSGHPACTILSDAGVMYEISEGIYNNNFDIEKYNFRNLKRKSLHYYLNMAKLLSHKKKWRTALSYINISLSYGVNFFVLNEMKLKCMLEIDPASYFDFLDASIELDGSLGNTPKNYLSVLNRDFDVLVKLNLIENIIPIFNRFIQDAEAAAEISKLKFNLTKEGIVI